MCYCVAFNFPLNKLLIILEKKKKKKKIEISER